MSDSSELVKNFDKLRDYMREFYVYGFRSREQLAGKAGRSGRSYDNEKRRIESYLADFMTFRQDRSGKNVFLSVDSAAIPENPLYRAFKAKTFTKNDIALHFMILDLLADGVGRTAGRAAEELDRAYLASSEEPWTPDVSTVRKKLSEYEKLGILRAEREGKTLAYYLNSPEEDCGMSPEALAFFSEMSPLGVCGSFLMDREGVKNRAFCWKHHYIMPVLDSEICGLLASAAGEKRRVEIRNHSPRNGGFVVLPVLPLLFLASAGNGRRYLVGYHCEKKMILPFRLDYIQSVRILEEDGRWDSLRGKAEEILRFCWGVSFGNGRQPARLVMRLQVGRGEGYIAERLKREGRHGVSTQESDGAWRYEAEVWDPSEMLPWLRTFTGRILSLSCSEPAVTERFYADLARMCELASAPCESGGAGAERERTWGAELEPSRRSPAAEDRHGAAGPVLFHEIYSSYYLAAERMIREAAAGTLNEKRAAEIASETAFAESFLYILDAVKSGQWQVITKDWKTPLTRLPRRPLTQLERRWIAAVRLDPRMRLFEGEDARGAADAGAAASTAAREADAEPLYRPEDFRFTDQFSDGDPYGDEAYRKTFRTVLAAVRDGTPLWIDYQGKKGRRTREVYRPYRLEYSEKDDKFRLLAKNRYGPAVVNLARILDCGLETDGQRMDGQRGRDGGLGGGQSAMAAVSVRAPKNRRFRPGPSAAGGRTYAADKQRVALELLDERNALERCMIQFADLEKVTAQISGRRYRVELSYRSLDETEILIRILSFGPMMRVLGPDRFARLLGERLEKQKALAAASGASTEDLPANSTGG